MQAMLRHQWPGNVRELINVIERAVLLAPRSEIRIADLRSGESWTLDDTESTPSKSGAASAWQSLLGKPFSAARVEVLHAFEHDYLEHILDATKGRVGESARLAGLNERTLYGMMKRHGLRKEHFKETPRGRSR